MSGNTNSNTDPFIQIKDLSKHFGDFIAVDSVNLEIGRGELFCILGGSGCGKSTLLRMMAGFETPTTGRILIDGVDITDQAPYHRPVNMMFQSYAIFPHMTVEKNVAYGLEKDRAGKDEVKKRVAEILDLVKLSGLRFANIEHQQHRLRGEKLESAQQFFFIGFQLQQWQLRLLLHVLADD